MTKRNQSDTAKELRKTQTKSEGLLWSVLRGKQLCGLKFRRQHPIGPFYVDFACFSERLVVEIDGGYHDLRGEADLQRQAFLRRNGWSVIRFTDQEVEENPEGVASAIASHLGVQFNLTMRKRTGSGMRHHKARNPAALPARSSRPPQRGGGGG